MISSLSATELNADTKVYCSRMMRLTIAIRALRLEVELIVNVKHFVRGAKASHLFVRAGCARTARRDAGAPSEFHDMPHNLFNSLQSFSPNSGKTGQFHSLPQLEKEGIGKISRLPVSIRIVLESVLRNFDGTKITEDDVRSLANWQPNAERTEEVPFVVARVLLQDFTGVPLLVDLAAMRSARSTSK